MNPRSSLRLNLRLNLRRTLLTAATGAILVAGAGCNETASAAKAPDPSTHAVDQPAADQPDANGKVGLSKAFGDLDFKTLDEYTAHVDDMDECQRTMVFSRVAVRVILDTDGSEAASQQAEQSIQDFMSAHADQFPAVFNTVVPTIYADNQDKATGDALTQWFKDNCADLMAQLQANAKN